MKDVAIQGLSDIVDALLEHGFTTDAIQSVLARGVDAALQALPDTAEVLGEDVTLDTFRDALRIAVGAAIVAVLDSLKRSTVVTPGDNATVTWDT